MTKVTIDFDDQTATALNRWRAKTAVSVGLPYLAVGKAVAAMRLGAFSRCPNFGVSPADGNCVVVSVSGLVGPPYW